MKLIAVRPGQKLYRDGDIHIIVEEDGERIETDIPLHSILARGYWEEPVRKHNAPIHPGTGTDQTVHNPDKRVGARQRPSKFITPDGFPMARDGIGDTYEDLLLSAGLPPQSVVPFTVPPTHTAGLGNRLSPIDVVIGEFAIEVKTVNSQSKDWKATMKKTEMVRKYAQAKIDMKRPATLIQVVDQSSRMVEVYFFADMYASKSVKRRTPDYTYTYSDAQLWASYERQGFGDRRNSG